MTDTEPRGCCQPNCMLKHVVSVSYSGKTVLVFGGIFLMTYDGVTQHAAFIGGLNAIMMAAGQVWYTAYWNVWGGVDDFAANGAEEPAHPLINRCCGINGCGLAAGLWTFGAIWYYVAYAYAFWWCADEVEPMPLAQSYVIAASAWHAWCAVLLAATTLSQCCWGPGEGWARVSVRAVPTTIVSV